ncbi:MAG: alpha-L-fucosidase, partial [candidate division Zixibacteria bacterium]|nr:alpha-L-fucosidase [candidate division Zixibacteria bacterium]
KGGNLLLNIGPSPEGELAPASLERLKELGAWMKVNSSALYGTRAIAPYKEGKICFTRMMDGTINAVYLADESEKQPPETMTITAFAPKAGSPVMMLGVTEPLKWEKIATGFVVHLPESVRTDPPCSYAWTLCFTPEKP